MAKLHPPVLWAQDKKRIFLTVELNNIKKNNVKLEPKVLEFDVIGGSDQKEYAFTLNLNQEVIPADSKYGVLPNKRNLEIVLIKKVEGSWPKLQQESKKPNWLKTDFSRFKDSDESDTEEPEGGDFANVMNQLGSFEQPEMPDDMPEEEDSDDDMPDLTDS
ncbi:co-chaperone protein daf-41-like [Lineus longissimus]|uniref:co-chaperone protein daf-41-like n=1 Tax=Lineus longissimus TaxID=88925 RepID=UPI002B4F7F28